VALGLESDRNVLEFPLWTNVASDQKTKQGRRSRKASRSRVFSYETKSANSPRVVSKHPLILSFRPMGGCRGRALQVHHRRNVGGDGFADLQLIIVSAYELAMGFAKISASVRRM
jgi:hypothetical protein